MKPQILIITSTIRQGRVSLKLAKWYLHKAQQFAPEADFSLLDIADLNLPLFNEPIPPKYAEHQYTAAQQELADKIGQADGYVIVTGEYNYTIPAPLKNMIDYLSPREWQHKAVAYVGYGAIGGFWAINHLIHTMSSLRVMSITDTVTISSVWEALDQKSEPKPDYIRGNIKNQLDELLWWATALKTKRLVS